MAMDPITAALDIGGKLVDRLWPDPAKKAEAALELLKLQQSGELAEMTAQLQVDQEEAKNPSVFVSGWRPFVGWVCAAGLAVQFIVNPVVTWIAELLHHSVAFPSLDMGTLMTLLVGMLGMGGMRTVEKLNNVAAK